MADHLRHQLAEMLQNWQTLAQPIGVFRGSRDDYERGYRTGFARALTKCADELRQLLAKMGEGNSPE